MAKAKRFYEGKNKTEMSRAKEGAPFYGRDRSTLTSGSTIGTPYYDGVARPMRARHPSMIDDAPNNPCNLPTEVMMKMYPKSPYDNIGYVDTLYNGVEKQMNEDMAGFRKAKGPRKY